MKHLIINIRWAIKLLKDLNRADYYKIIIRKDNYETVEEMSLSKQAVKVKAVKT